MRGNGRARASRLERLRDATSRCASRASSRRRATSIPTASCAWKCPARSGLVVLAPPSRMENRGLARGALRPGVKAKVEGYPSRGRPRRNAGRADHDRRQDDRAALMHAPVGPAFLVWLETSGLATLMRQSQWLYPHRRDRAHRRLRDAGGQRRDVRPAPPRDCRGACRSRAWRGICCAGRSRASCWSCRPASRCLPRTPPNSPRTPAFRVKVLLLVAAATNAVLFHRTSFRSVANWNTAVAPPTASRVAAVTSLALWIGVICCGRLIAYL